MRRSCTACCLLLAVMATGAWARDGEDVLAASRQLYEQGKYDSTAALITSFLRNNGRDPSAEHLVPLLLESLVRTGDDRHVRRLVTVYLRKYAQSPYAARVHYLSGVAHVRGEEYARALQDFSAARKLGLNPQLDSLALATVRSLCERSLTVEEVGKFLETGPFEPGIEEVLRYCHTVKLYEAGRTGQARQAAGEFSREYSRSPFASDVKSLQSKARAQQRDQISVGLLAPLSGYDADLGKSIVQGVQLAVDTYNRAHPYKINLIIADTRADMVTTAYRTRELIEEHQVSVILGPVLSSTAVVAAAMLAGREIVMITPTATEDGIARLDPFVFQLNVTLGVLGRRMARYAMHNLAIREFAILSPLSDYGRLVSESFKNEISAQGGSVVAHEWYDEGANDFRPQFESLRGALIQRRRDTAHDNLLGSEGAPFREDSLRLLDSVLAVGGLFMPAEAPDVVMLAPQVAFHKIRTQLLGATGWHTPRVILDGKRYVNDAFVVTGAEVSPQDPLWLDFSERYNRQFSREPDRVAALGYDAASLIVSLLSNRGGAIAGPEIAAALRKLQGYRGVSGLVSFDPSTGVNTEAGIVKISNRQFVRVE